jgi:LysM repeat protein
MGSKLQSEIALGVRPPTTYIDAKSLGAGVAEEAVVPEGYDVVIFGASAAPFYVRVNAVAAVPADTSDGTASACSPTAYRVKAGDTISIIAPAATVVTLEYYRAFR